MTGNRISYYSKNNQFYLGKAVGERMLLSEYKDVSIVNRDGSSVVSLFFHGNGPQGDLANTSALASNGRKELEARCFTNDRLVAIIRGFLGLGEEPVNIYLGIISMSRERATLDIDMSEFVTRRPKCRKKKNSPVERRAEQVELPAPYLFKKQERVKLIPEGSERAVRKLIVILGRSGVLTNNDVRELLSDLAAEK